VQRRWEWESGEGSVESSEGFRKEGGGEWKSGKGGAEEMEELA
jgi:hypothetical protein